MNYMVKAPRVVAEKAMKGYVKTSIWHACGRLSSRLRGVESRQDSSEDRPDSEDQIGLPADTIQNPPRRHPDGNFQHNARAAGNPLSIQLSIHTLDSVVRELVPFFGEDCPISIIYNKRPAQMVHSAEVVQATLATIQNVPEYAPQTRSAFILVG
jgi:hypothetical protein